MNVAIQAQAPFSGKNLAFTSAPGGVSIERNTGTIGNFGNSFTSIGNMVNLSPPFYCCDINVLSASGATLTCDYLHRANTYSASFYVGGKLYVRHVVGGELVEKGETAVTAAVIKRRFSLFGNNAVDKNESQVVHSPDSWEQPGATKYFVLASIDETGKRSAWTSPVSFTYPSAPSPVERTATTSKTETKFDEMVQDAGLPVPQNVQVTTINEGNSARISWTPLPNHRVIIGHGWHSDVNVTNIETLTIADSGLVTAGDMVWFKKDFDHTVQRSVISPRVYNDGGTFSKFRPHFEAFNGEHPQGITYTYMNVSGKKFIRYTIPSGVNFTCGIYAHSGSGQNFYHVPTPGKPYALRAEIKVDAPKTVTMKMDAADVPSQSLSATTSWQTFDRNYTFSSQLTTSSPLRETLNVTGPCVFDVAFFTLFDPAMEPLGLALDQEQLLIDSGMLSLRMHATCKTKPWSYRMSNMLARYGTGATIGNSLAQSYFALKDFRARNNVPGQGNPWSQIEPHMSDAELALLSGYLCTTYSAGAPDSLYKQGAKLRFDQGQVEPWQDVFDRITIECGNENWNGLNDFYSLPAVNGQSNGWVNAKLLDRYEAVMKANPDFNRAKFKFYLGGGASQGSFSNESANASENADFFGYADYNGGWDSGLSEALQAGDPVAMFDTLANSNRVVNGKTRLKKSQDLVALCAAASVGRTRPLLACHYESGPGYVLNGLNGASVTPAQSESQELLMKSVASGTATLDAFMVCAENGIVSNDFFTLERGPQWKAWTNAKDGGAYNPPFMWFCFINHHLIGTVQKMNLVKDEDLISPAGLTQGKAVKGSQVTRADGATCYVLRNLDPDGDATIKLRRVPGPGTLTRHYMTGDAKDSNITLATSNDIEILSQTIAGGFGQDGLTVTLPPGKAEVYIFEPA